MESLFKCIEVRSLSKKNHFGYKPGNNVPGYNNHIVNIPNGRINHIVNIPKVVNNKFGKSQRKPKLKKGLTADQYTIAPSTIPNAGNGAFTNIPLPKGSVLGNYTGKKLSKEQYNRLKDQSYVWELSSKYGPVYIDGKNPKISNWLRFLNDSRDRRVNVEPYQYQGKLYYRTIKNVKPGSELFISYGDSYW